MFGPRGGGCPALRPEGVWGGGIYGTRPNGDGQSPLQGPNDVFVGEPIWRIEIKRRGDTEHALAGGVRRQRRFLEFSTRRSFYLSENADFAESPFRTDTQRAFSLPHVFWATTRVYLLGLFARI